MFQLDLFASDTNVGIVLAVVSFLAWSSFRTVFLHVGTDVIVFVPLPMTEVDFLASSTLSVC